VLTKLLVFGAVALLTRSPIFAAIVTLAVWVVVDWNAFQLLPRLGRRFWDLRRLFELRRGLAQNPHDRRARVELGELYVRLRRPAAAIEVVREAVEVDPYDEAALYTLGVACLHQGERARGELFLGELEASRPEFRQGEIPFELALAARRAGDAKAAREALGRFLHRHPASVRGLALLGEILAAQGEAAGAAAARDQAWAEFVELPRFARRQARAWAWRAKPGRPFAYLGVAALVAAIIWVVPRLS